MARISGLGFRLVCQPDLLEIQGVVQCFEYHLRYLQLRRSRWVSSRTQPPPANYLVFPQTLMASQNICAFDIQPRYRPKQRSWSPDLGYRESQALRSIELSHRLHQ